MIHRLPHWQLQRWMEFNKYEDELMEQARKKAGKHARRGKHVRGQRRQLSFTQPSFSRLRSKPMSARDQFAAIVAGSSFGKEVN